MAISSCLPENRIGAPLPLLMVYGGPTLYVEIGFDSQYRAGQTERPNLPPTPHPALVDTGARESCVDATVARDLGLPVYGEKQISGIFGPQQATVYRAQIYIPPLDETIFGDFYGVTMSGQFYQRAILGRDFLFRCVFHYDGRTGEVTISNDR